VCLNCGVFVAEGASYDIHPENGKKIVKRLLRRCGLRLEDVDRQIYACRECIEQLTEEDRDKTRKANPMSRRKAEKAVQFFLEDIKRVNQDDRFDSYINVCVVFGSFLSDKEKISDIDLTLFNRWKPSYVCSTDHFTEKLKLREELDRLIAEVCQNLREELDWLITEAGNLTPFQFHAWQTLAFFKAIQGDSFRYEYLYAESPEAMSKIEIHLEKMAQRIKYKRGDPQRTVTLLR
ncbi:MAG TPA: hypothetical protein VKN82_02235, partial [Desulfohalobiaceae bacterium]|nr:hypothetical protein [Desulfohalobiaceae bacterium]